MTLDELCEKAAEGSVTLRGTKRDVRPITAMEASRIRRAYPRPVDPGNLNMAQKIAYEAACDDWGAKVQILEAAVGLNYQTKAGLKVGDAWTDTTKVICWGEAAWSELGNVLSESEVRMVLAAMQRAAVGSVEEASKNS